MLALLVLLAAADTTCTAPAICALRDRAIEANRTPGRIASYTADVQSEAAVISVRAGFVDGPSSIESYASTVSWDRDGEFRQHAIGFRARSANLPMSTVRWLLLGWITPMTYGDHIAIFGRQAGGDSLVPGHRGIDPGLVYAISPLGAESHRYYRFTRVDTTRAGRFDGDTLTVYRMSVEPISLPRERRLLFRGAVDLVPGSLQIVRMRGSLESSGEQFELYRGLRFASVPKVSYCDLVNAPAADGTWLPSVQRFEWHGTSAPGGGTSALRVVSIFRNLTVDTAVTAGAEYDDRPVFVLSSASGDSLHRFKKWAVPLGLETSRFDVTDFSDLKRGIRISGGQLFVPAPRPGESILRYNRIEGIYVGVPLTYTVGDALPGVFAHANGGYAFWEDAVRWNAAVGWETPALGFEFFGGRYLDVTNKFRSQFDTYALGAFLSRDNWDYLDREGAGMRGRVQLGQRRGTQVTVSAAYLEDQPLVSILKTAPYVGYLRPNRGIYQGKYLRTLTQVDINPDISPVYVRNGVGAQLIYDAGYGDLNYQRLEARLIGRYDFSKMFIIVRAHVGAVFGDSVPPQQLFEIGGAAGLPGFDYKEFAGDRAALTRVRLTWPLPFLRTPIVVKPGISLPVFTPSLSFGVQGAWTDISNARVQAAVNALGFAFDTKTGQPKLDPVTGLPLPASVETDGLASSADIRVGFFNDALSVGVAHPLTESTHGFSFFLAFGRQF